MNVVAFFGEKVGLLQSTNYKAANLAILRVAICSWLLKEVLINWSSMEMLYGASSFVPAAANIVHYWKGATYWVNHHYFLLMSIHLLIILLQLTGIGKWYTALLLFVSVNMVHQMNPAFHDGGYKMVRLIVLYLIFADSYQHLAFRKTRVCADTTSLRNLLSNLAALTIMLQLCAAYFSSGIIKMNDATWRQGQAVYYVMLYERFTGTQLNSLLATKTWLMMLLNYFVMAIEVLFPFLVWFKKIRPLMLVAGLMLHAGIYLLMMIYSFQWIFLFIYVLFLPSERVKRFLVKISRGYFR